MKRRQEVGLTVFAPGESCLSINGHPSRLPVSRAVPRRTVLSIEQPRCHGRRAAARLVADYAARGTGWTRGLRASANSARKITSAHAQGIHMNGTPVVI